MHYHPETVNAAGYAVLGSTALGSGLVWCAGLVADVPPAVVNAAGANAVTACILTIAAIAVNGWIADRKSKRESDERIATAQEIQERKVAEALVVADQKLLEAKSEADKRIAALETRIALADQLSEQAAHARHDRFDKLYTMVNALYCQIDDNSKATNKLISAVAENASRLGSDVPIPDPVVSPFVAEGIKPPVITRP